MPPAGGALDNLGRMQDNLPPTEVAEKELQQAFRVAALSLTGLFKVGKKATNKGMFSLGIREEVQGYDTVSGRSYCPAFERGLDSHSL